MRIYHVAIFGMIIICVRIISTDRVWNHRTTRHRLIHDLEQFNYLLRNDHVTMTGYGLKLFGSTLPQLYKKTLLRLDDAVAADKRGGGGGAFNEENDYYKFTSEDSELVQYYNRVLFMPELPAVEGPKLTPRDWGQVERDWLGEDANYPHPGIVVVDNILSPQTLKRVREYLLLSTFWYDLFCSCVFQICNNLLGV